MTLKKKSMVPNIFCHDNIIRFSAFISKYFFSSIFDKVITVNLHYIAMWIFCLTGDVSFKNQQLTILLQKLWGPKLTLILKNISYNGYIRKRSTSKTSGNLEFFGGSWHFKNVEETKTSEVSTDVLERIQVPRRGSWKVPGPPRFLILGFQLTFSVYGRCWESYLGGKWTRL